MSPFGREVRIVPGKRLGLLGPTALAVPAVLLALLTAGVAGEESTQTEDLVILGVLFALTAVPAVLLFLRRRARIAEGLVYRVFESGLARETRRGRDDLSFNDVARLERAAARRGQLRLSLVTRAGVHWLLDSARLDGVDDRLDALLGALLQGRRPPALEARDRLDRTHAAAVEFHAVEGHPAPLVGAGRLELGPTGVRFEGPASRALLPVLAGVLVAVAGLIATAVVFSAFDAELGRKTGKAAAMVALVVGLLPGISVYELARRRLKGRRLDVLVPWSAVQVDRADPPRAVVHLTAPDLRGTLQLVARDADSSAVVASVLAPLVE